MGVVNPRLERLYSLVRDEASLPIIVATNVAPTVDMLNGARAVGAGPITFVSGVTRMYGTIATREVAFLIAGLSETREVFPDEPIAAVGKRGNHAG